MAKTYVSTVKYLIKLKFEVGGVVDKPDLIGAIFGQSEGLLGDEMDLKELQNSGKVGRIEINLASSMGKTTGEILVPSSMDMVETSILAAAIESVEKVGPCDSRFTVASISDVRKEKRESIKSRAQQLLEKFKQQLPEAQEMKDEIVEGTRVAGVIECGPDRLAAGPEIESEDSIIVVEGRADVLNLLRNNIKNVISMGGAKISETIVELSRRKSITAFVDGDRGGDLNARKLQQIARIDFIARAPDGKEVEELTRKEIIQSLKKKLPVSSIPERPWGAGRASGSQSRGSVRPQRRDSFRRPMQRGFERRKPRFEGGSYQAREFIPIAEVEEERLTSDEEKKFLPVLSSLRRSFRAKLFDEKMNEIKETNVRELIGELDEAGNVHAIVFDGIITKRLAEKAEAKGVSYLIGIRKAKIEKGKIKAVAISE